MADLGEHKCGASAADIAPRREGRAQTAPLHLLACGDAGGGKRTLIDRLVGESGKYFADRPDAAEFASGQPDDKAAGRICTSERRFVIAGAQADDRWLGDLIGGVSCVEMAIILVDACKGLSTPMRRHACLLSLIGMRGVVLAVNKMDLVDCSERVFNDIADHFREFARQIGLADVTAVPVSALDGGNVFSRSERMAWYRGETLAGLLDALPVDPLRLQRQPFRLPVQWIDRPEVGLRGFAGTVVSGVVRPGDRIRVQPSGQESTILRVVDQDGDLPQAVAGQPVTLTLADAIETSRADLISAVDSPAEVADQFEATVVWMCDEPMLGGRQYLLKIGTRTVVATPAAPKYVVSVDTLDKLAAAKLGRGDIGVCNLSLDRQIAFDPCKVNRHTGGFVLIDALTDTVAGVGMLGFALRRAHNIHLQHVDVDKFARATAKGQRPCVVWFTGLSGAGKSTIANLVEKKLHALGRHTYLLDGDNVRHGLNRDLGFTDADRVENIRRIAEVARLMADAGLIVLTAFISPFRAERRMARGLLPEGEFVEVYVDTPLDVAETRDTKGLYKKARKGELKNFTGIDSPYEKPERPELVLVTAERSAEQLADELVAVLRARGIVD